MTQSQNVSFLDLAGVHQELENELVPVFQKALRTAGFIGGPMVEEFEADFARFCESRYCIGVNSGTDALRFALTAAGVREGDIVLTVPNTFIATTEAISQAGARPEFVDVDPISYNMDPEKLRKYVETNCTFDDNAGRLIHRTLGKPVTAVIPVHLYGQMVDMDPILQIAARYKMIVIEDACQAHGAQYFSKKEGRWRTAGSMGRAAAFSFYPGKNLGACGEGGAVTTDDEELAKKIRMIRDHGQARKYYHDIEGYNGRLDSIQAGILTVKLKHLAGWNAKRRDAAARYRDLFEGLGDLVTLPQESSSARSVFHLYVVRVRDREALQEYLKSKGIGTGIHYPVPLHLQKAYSHLGFKLGDFPVAEAAASEILSLPMFPQLTASEQKSVVQEIRQHVCALAG
jgi:dTDP-4-amino-4,6-dideoxygalactose transaminase